MTSRYKMLPVFLLVGILSAVSVYFLLGHLDKKQSNENLNALAYQSDDVSERDTPQEEAQNSDSVPEGAATPPAEEEEEEIELPSPDLEQNSNHEHPVSTDEVSMNHLAEPSQPSAPSTASMLDARSSQTTTQMEEPPKMDVAALPTPSFTMISVVDESASSRVASSELPPGVQPAPRAPISGQTMTSSPPTMETATVMNSPVPTEAQLQASLRRLRPQVLHCVEDWRGELAVTVSYRTDGRISSRVGRGPSRQGRYCVQRIINESEGFHFQGRAQRIRFTYSL